MLDGGLVYGPDGLWVLVEEEEEVGLQISDSHLKLSVASWGPSGVSQHGHLGLVDI